MTNSTPIENDSIDNHIDDHVDQEIQECFSVEDPKCFFVFAGAGSGKTRSLINILTFLDEDRGESLSKSGKQIAVILMRHAMKYLEDYNISQYSLYPRYIVFYGS